MFYNTLGWKDLSGTNIIEPKHMLQRKLSVVNMHCGAGAVLTKLFFLRNLQSI